MQTLLNLLSGVSRPVRGKPIIRTGIRRLGMTVLMPGPA